ncbi:MAG TPA: trypsin-like peptidase domain-containing protein [Phycisphaerales bacterium]|nr:trypsin-like peptidase domain-containing protein [Phycisphaerales bacterium]
MRRFVAFGPALVVLLVAAVAVFAVPEAVRRIGAANTAVQIELARQTLDTDDILERLNRATRAIADAVEPSVVHIEVDSPSESGRPVASNGSGWMYDSAGHVVTNAHVVRNAVRVTAHFYDGRVMSATIVGTDPFTDIAVIKVADEGTFFPAKRATGDRPQRGDRVYAFGSPFGFRFSMSEGIVSALGRSPQTAMEFGGFTNFIQTDAAVNPGNSGGPLVNSRGMLIGMNVAIANARTTRGENEGQSAGISFAIPLAMIESVADQLIQTGEVKRGFLGARFITDDSWRDDDSGEWFSFDGLFAGRALRVRDVNPDGPAQRAGIRSGDILVAIDGESVPAMKRLRSIISSYKPGDKPVVKLIREGQFLEIPVELGRMPFNVLTSMDPAPFLRSLVGIRVEEVGGGVKISQVWDDSPAAENKLAVDETIIAVGGRSVTTLEGLAEALYRDGIMTGSKVQLTVKAANGETRPVYVQAPSFITRD